MRRAAPVALVVLLLASALATVATSGGGGPFPETNETYQPTYLEYLVRTKDTTAPLDLVFGGPSNPHASLARSPSGVVQPGEPVTFDASGSFARSGTYYGGTSIANWVWDFGDGHQANAPVVVHAYDEAGHYRVNLVVHDDTGWRASAATSIEVGTAPCGGPGRAIEVPTTGGLLMRGFLTVPSGPGPFPAVLEYGPYPPSSAGDCEMFVRSGYAHARIAAPGRILSDGVFDLFGAGTQRGGYDAVEWLASQPWSSGKVGMYGVSGPGIGALITAAASPPHLAAVVVRTAWADPYRDMIYAGGVPNSDTFVNLWLTILTAGEAQLYQEMGLDSPAIPHAVDNARLIAEIYAHPFFDAWWKERAPVEYPSPQAAVLVVSNHRDLWPRGGVELARWIAPTGGRVIAIPGGHGTTDRSGWVPSSMSAGEGREWFDHFLKGEANGVEERPRILTFTTYGGDTAATFNYGRWEQLTSFPDPATRPLQLHLRTLGSNLERPTYRGLSVEPPGLLDAPALLPWTPLQGATSDNTAPTVPEVGGLQEPWEAQSLVYETPVLTEDLRVNGPATLSFRATRLATDLAFTVTIDDVWPDGSAHYISKGELLASHRALNQERSLYLGEGAERVLIRPYHDHAPDASLALSPGANDRFDVEIWGVHNVFKAGHRLRLVLSAQDIAWRAHAQPGLAAVVWHDPAAPSTLNLAILPEPASREPFPYP